MTDIFIIDGTSLEVSSSEPCFIPCFPAYSCEWCMSRLPIELHPALMLKRGLQTRWSIQAGEYLLDYAQNRISHSSDPNCEGYLDRNTQRVMIFALKQIQAGEKLSLANKLHA